VDLRVEHEKFENYFHAQPGIGGRKVNWGATWRNWIIKAAEWHHNGEVTRNGFGKPSRKALGWHDAAEELINELNEAGALLPEIQTNQTPKQLE
jgi:hypothetical protein